MINDHADPSTEKREAYRAATALLAKQDEASLRYAALELRRCIEAIVYEKLKVYGSLLPEGSVHQWQPPQAFDALIEIEPNAEQTFTFAVAPQKEFGQMPDTPFRSIGTDERPKAKWIKKTWHKLGSYLHAEWPFAANKASSSPRPFLEKTAAELALLVKSSFSGMISMNIDFQCSGCGATVRVMEKAVESSRAAACLNCGVHYRAEKSEDAFTFYPDEPPFTCDCGAVNIIPTRHVEVGYPFSCRTCKCKFRIVGLDWKYEVVADDVAPSESVDK